jgi:hypothetical protein
MRLNLNIKVYPKIFADVVHNEPLSILVITGLSENVVMLKNTDVKVRLCCCAKYYLGF